jgi:hypothetical protein
MAFTDDTFLTSEQVSDIEEKYKEVSGVKNVLSGTQASNSGNEVTFTDSVKTNVLEKLDAAISEVNGFSKLVSSYAHLQTYFTRILEILTTIKDSIGRKTEENKIESKELTEKIVQGIGSVDTYLADMRSHIDKLKVSHKTHTCNTVGSDFTFSKEKLSGKDKKITISVDGKTATQNDTSLKCLWLTTDQGIPTDCDNAVTWAIKITTSYVKNLPEMLMGVGLDGFNPLITGSRSGAKDCDVIPGFWGFSGTDSFNNGVKSSNSFSNSFTNNGDYIFTLTPELKVTANRNFTLKITLNTAPASSNEIVFELDSSIEFIYPIVRFKSKGDTYTFIDAPVVAPAPVVALEAPVPAIADAAPDPAPVVALEAPDPAPGPGPAPAPVVALEAPVPAPAAEDNVVDVNDAAADNYVNKLPDNLYNATRKKEIKDIMLETNFDIKKMSEQGVTAGEMIKMKFILYENHRDDNVLLKELLVTGFSHGQLLRVGFSATALKGANITVEKLWGDKKVDPTITASDLKNAGFTAMELKGKVPRIEIINAGFTNQQLKVADIIQNRFFSFFSKKGGKSGSGITRKRRLRLKKSRNITRHKGGKKSVRFSARVKLNNGHGKGSSSMNKRTHKVSSSSYKLSARRVIKLKP